MVSARDLRALRRGLSRAGWDVVEAVAARPVTLAALVAAGVVGVACGRRLGAA